MAVHPRERDERQVDRVEHQLDAHEHHDGVAAQQHTRGPDGEQQRRKVKVISRIHDAPPFTLSTGALSTGALSTGEVSTGEVSLPSAPRLRNMGDTDNFEYDPSGNSAATSTAF